jgi:hypothetical protein
MANGSMLTDLAQTLDAMERQARCLAEYLRRGDLELAIRLSRQLAAALTEIPPKPR